MATLTPAAKPAITGSTETYVAASGGGDIIATNGQHTTLRVKNGDSAPHTVTLVCVRACSLGATSPTHDVVVVVAATSEEDIEIPAHVVDPDTGHVEVTYSAVTSVTVAPVFD